MGLWRARHAPKVARRGLSEAKPRAWLADGTIAYTAAGRRRSPWLGYAVPLACKGIDICEGGKERRVDMRQAVKPPAAPFLYSAEIGVQYAVRGKSKTATLFDDRAWRQTNLT